MIQFVFHALVAADMELPTHSVCSGLNDGVDRNLGHNIGKDFSLFIVLDGHVASFPAQRLVKQCKTGVYISQKETTTTFVGCRYTG